MYGDFEVGLWWHRRSSVSLWMEKLSQTWLNFGRAQVALVERPSQGCDGNRVAVLNQPSQHGPALEVTGRRWEHKMVLVGSSLAALTLPFRTVVGFVLITLSLIVYWFCAHYFGPKSICRSCRARAMCVCAHSKCLCQLYVGDKILISSNDCCRQVVGRR